MYKTLKFQSILYYMRKTDMIHIMMMVMTMILNLTKYPEVK